MVPESAPRVSVVVFLRDRHSKVRETLESLRRQTRFEEIEVILADGRPEAERDGLLQDFPWPRHLDLPGRNMPQLKGAAVRAARGDIVAILDPWDAAEPDWIDEILAALADPSVIAAGGVVALDGPATAANRAAYVYEYGAFNPPIAAGPTDADLPGNNLALRRRFLIEHCADILETEGFNKAFCQARLRARGGLLIFHPPMRVRHLTDYRFMPFAVRRFHYARCFGAVRRRLSPWPRKLLYCVFAPTVPVLLMLRNLPRVRRHPPNRRHLDGAVLPFLGICAVWGLGEWIGYWFGAGRSCEKFY
jgi:glycosyltransferase involved in cell wall biosynthesis